MPKFYVEYMQVSLYKNMSTLERQVEVIRSRRNQLTRMLHTTQDVSTLNLRQ